MNTVFIGGSRHISRLNARVKERLANVIGSGHRVVVGDANGADKAVQKYLHEAAYPHVTVFCSGSTPRNNLGPWEARQVATGKEQKGFQFYAAKDREMAREADFGLMIWDGKSPGTALNILRLMRAGKKAVLLNLPEERAINFKSTEDWQLFLSGCSVELVRDLKERATPEEWASADQPELLPAGDIAPAPPKSDEEWEAVINAALASGDPGSVLDTLGSIARARGMSQVANDAGLARESLYRALGSGGNPEFATVFKVIGSLGLRLTVSESGQQGTSAL